MKQNLIFPTMLARAMLSSGLIGILVGLALSFYNHDALGWSLLRASILGVVFAVATRWVCMALIRTWIESRVEVTARPGKPNGAGVSNPAARSK